MTKYEINNAILKDLYEELVDFDGVVKLFQNQPLRNSSTLDLVIKNVSHVPYGKCVCLYWSIKRSGIS